MSFFAWPSTELFSVFEATLPDPLPIIAACVFGAVGAVLLVYLVWAFNRDEGPKYYLPQPRTPRALSTPPQPTIRQVPPLNTQTSAVDEGVIADHKSLEEHSRSSAYSPNNERHPFTNAAHTRKRSPTAETTILTRPMATRDASSNPVTSMTPRDYSLERSDVGMAGALLDESDAVVQQRRALRRNAMSHDQGIHTRHAPGHPAHTSNANPRGLPPAGPERELLPVLGDVSSPVTSRRILVDTLDESTTHKSAHSMRLPQLSALPPVNKRKLRSHMSLDTRGLAGASSPRRRGRGFSAAGTIPSSGGRVSPLPAPSAGTGSLTPQYVPSPAPQHLSPASRSKVDHRLPQPQLHSTLHASPTSASSSLIAGSPQSVEGRPVLPQVVAVSGQSDSSSDGGAAFHAAHQQHQQHQQPVPVPSSEVGLRSTPGNKRYALPPVSPSAGLHRTHPSLSQGSTQLQVLTPGPPAESVPSHAVPPAPGSTSVLHAAPSARQFRFDEPAPVRNGPYRPEHVEQKNNAGPPAGQAYPSPAPEYAVPLMMPVYSVEEEFPPPGHFEVEVPAGQLAPLPTQETSEQVMHPIVPHGMQLVPVYDPTNYTVATGPDGFEVPADWAPQVMQIEPLGVEEANPSEFGAHSYADDDFHGGMETVPVVLHDQPPAFDFPFVADEQPWVAHQQMQRDALGYPVQPELF